MSQERRRYPSDLTDQQWEIIKGMIPSARSGGRRRKTDMRRVVEALLYITKTGSPWRYLPSEFPPWKTVHDYFSKWTKSGALSQINLALTKAVRAQLQREETPSLALIDSQSAKSHYGERRGYDAAKKVRGRKRSIIVDTLGLIWSCEVHEANMTDPKGGLAALEKFPNDCRKRLTKFIADSAYKWPFDYFAEKVYGLEVQLLDTKKLGTNMTPKRWVVERTFAWFNHFRRLSRDYERVTRHSEAIIYLAMISILLRRLSP
jgi:putative transposase